MSGPSLTRRASWRTVAGNDLAGIAELAEMCGESPSTICNWAKRYASFPAPLAVLAAGRIYSRAEVRKWLGWPDE